MGAPLSAHLQRLARANGLPWPPRPTEDAAADEAPDGLAWCPTCRGRRWLRPNVSTTDPAFGRLVRCPECPPAVRQAQAAAFAAERGLSQEQRMKTFETFRPQPGTEAAVRAARRWAAEPDGWLVLTGVPGSGKTHLSCAVTNALLDRLVAVHWWYAPELAGAFKAAIETNETAAVLERAQQAPVLVLDDLGAVQPTDFAIRALLEPLFNARERKRLPTLVTCIGDPEAIKGALSESIGRRMQDASLCQVVAITAPQYRAPRPSHAVASR